jgi:hypothetical protein
MATRKQIGEAFKAAKELTARNGKECSSAEWNGKGKSGRFEFICHALDTLHLMPGAMGAKAVINDRFVLPTRYCAPTIYSWLYDVAGVRSSQLTDDNVQAYKHRWLDSVIKEFSS